MTVTLTFHGAAGTVTGSHYLLETPQARIAVDCGMFQGPKTLKELNYQPLPSSPGKLDAVVQTHAHTDHSGMLPKLVKSGFTGPIFATQGTRDLLEWMLPDSASIQESGGRAPEPREPPPRPAGGAAGLHPGRRPGGAEADPSARVRDLAAGRQGHPRAVVERRPYPRLGLGRAGGRDWKRGAAALQHPVLRRSWPAARARCSSRRAGRRAWTTCCANSTYGNRERPHLDDDQRRDALAREVTQALGNGGNLLVPAFAIERSQELIGDLVYLMARQKLPKAPIYLDSPLAIRATEVFERHLKHLDDIDPKAGSPFRAPNVHFVQSVEQSMALNRIAGGAIIVASSGMCDAGRIRHHLRNQLWRPQNTVLLIGYQAPGTARPAAAGGRATGQDHGRGDQGQSAHQETRDLFRPCRPRRPAGVGQGKAADPARIVPDPWRDRARSPACARTC